jgi:hypothetical protein
MGDYSWVTSHLYVDDPICLVFLLNKSSFGWCNESYFFFISRFTFWGILGELEIGINESRLTGIELIWKAKNFESISGSFLVADRLLREPYFLFYLILLSLLLTDAFS